MDSDPDKRWRRDAIAPPPGTMAATWFEEGFAKGWADARAEWDREFALGMAELLLRLLERRFGEVPGTVRARVVGASTDELDAWSDALLEAATIEDVLASNSRR